MSSNDFTIKVLLNNVKTEIDVCPKVVSSAQKGDAESYYKIGSAYQLFKNYAKANKWYKFAADKNYDIAQFSLGSKYEHGQGFYIDYQTALEWYLKAAENGNKDAPYFIGRIFEEGRGVTVNKHKALEWYFQTEWYKQGVEKLVSKGYSLSWSEQRKTMNLLVRETEEILQFEKEKAPSLAAIRKMKLEKENMKNDIQQLKESNHALQKELTEIKELVTRYQKGNSSEPSEDIASESTLSVIESSGNDKKGTKITGNELELEAIQSEIQSLRLCYEKDQEDGNKKMELLQKVNKNLENGNQALFDELRLLRQSVSNIHDTYKQKDDKIALLENENRTLRISVEQMMKTTDLLQQSNEALLLSLAEERKRKA